VQLLTCLPKASLEGHAVCLKTGALAQAILHLLLLQACSTPALSSAHFFLAAAAQSIIETNNELRAALAQGYPADKVVESWDFLQVNAAMYINSDVPGLAQANQPASKPLRCARGAARMRSC
jgi:hypothetical protein